MSHHPAFKLLREKHIPALNIQAQEYQHKATGAIHVHLASDHSENVFLVALRTLPKDSSGVAHILEHTALCGSEKYPVRDPFFMMTRRSLNTFMNAFTSNDWTAYPFASKNKKDFNNLLDVYLDAVFFSRLDELDFAQEGHRLEFKEADNADTELTFKGVVFNEMKGAMSSINSTLWQTLSSYLYPSSTYHYNSGGDPEYIPDLSYQQLLDFYRKHYHPSNAIFMTFGDIPVQEHQAKFEQQALASFQASSAYISAEKEKRYHAPLKVQTAYAFDEPGSSDNKTHLIMGWLLGESTNLQEVLTAHLLSGVLLENSASPLLKMLETSELGSTPSALTGLEDSNRELVFCCGLAGSEAKHAEAFEQEVLKVLQQVEQQGVDTQELEAILHQLELHQREVGGDGYPYGLQLMLSILPAATHRGNTLENLDIEPALDYLRKAIQDPNFIPQQVRQLLLDNPHRITLTMTPDQNLASNREQHEKELLAEIKNQLSEKQKQAIIDQAEQLKQRQQQADDADLLPEVTLADVPRQLPEISCQHLHKSLDISLYQQGTNGLSYQQLVVELPALSQEELDILPYLSRCLTEVGIGSSDYLQIQQLQSQVCGSLTAFSNYRGEIDNEQNCHGYFILSGKALSRNHHALAKLMTDTFQYPRFDEHQRITEIISQIRHHRENSITGNGHSLAMLAASSQLSPTSALSHRLTGLQGLNHLKALDDKLQEDSQAVEDFCQALCDLHQKLLSQHKQAVIISEPESSLEQAHFFADLWPEQPDQTARFSLPATRNTCQQIWLTNTQVNFCAKAYPTVPIAHPDAAPLSVLGGLLRNGFLHRSIREQGGAYGGGALQDSNTACFKFYSYRDPRLLDTLSDFDQALDWLAGEEPTEAMLQEAILGIISNLDKPHSPAGEAKQAFHDQLFGRRHEIKAEFRARVLSSKLDDLRRVASLYLQPDKASTAIISNPNTIAKLDTELAGFEQFQV